MSESSDYYKTEFSFGDWDWRVISGEWPNGSVTWGTTPGPKTMKVPEISQVIYHIPYTIVNWADGSKTIVKAGENEVWDEEVGLAMAIVKKLYGTRSSFQREVENATRQLPKEDRIKK